MFLFSLFVLYIYFATIRCRGWAPSSLFRVKRETQKLTQNGKRSGGDSGHKGHSSENVFETSRARAVEEWNRRAEPWIKATDQLPEDVYDFTIKSGTSRIMRFLCCAKADIGGRYIIKMCGREVTCTGKARWTGIERRYTVTDWMQVEPPKN